MSVFDTFCQGKDALEPEFLREEYLELGQAYTIVQLAHKCVWDALDSIETEDPLLKIYYQAESLRISDFSKAIRILSDRYKSEPASVLCRTLLEVLWYMEFILTSSNPSASVRSLYLHSISTLLVQHDSSSIKSGIGRPLSDDPDKLREQKLKLESELLQLKNLGDDWDLRKLDLGSVCARLDKRNEAKKAEKSGSYTFEYDRLYRSWSQPTHGLMLGIRNYFEEDGSFYDPASIDVKSRSAYTAVATLELPLRFMKLGNDFFKLGADGTIRSGFQSYTSLKDKFTKEYGWA